MKIPAIRSLWPFRKGGTASQELREAGDAAVISQPEKSLAALEEILRAAMPGASVQLDDVFVGPRITPREHEWYYGAKCRWCHRTSAAFHDPNEGQTRLSLSGSGELHFHCHHCNGLLKVTPAQIIWFEFEG